MMQFKQFDANDDGRISKHELAKVLRELDAKRWCGDRIERLLQGIDRNGDGYIQFHEFCSWLYSFGDDAKLLVEAETLDAAATALRAKARSAQAAARSGSWESVLTYTQENPEIASIQNGSKGNTLLHEVALAGDLEIWAQLLSCNVDINVVNKAGLTPAQLVDDPMYALLALPTDDDANSKKGKIRFAAPALDVEPGKAETKASQMVFMPTIKGHNPGHCFSAG